MKKRLFQGALIFALVAGCAILSFGASKIQIGFSLSGGVSNINGGDFNRYIRDSNAFAADANRYWSGYLYSYSADWKEVRWLARLSGEIYIRFGETFGVGLGAEFYNKTNPGTLGSDYFYPFMEYGSGSYALCEVSKDLITRISQTLTVTPITLSFYRFLPVGPHAEAYVKLGVGYYRAKLASDLVEAMEYIYKEIWYENGGALLPPHYQYRQSEAYTESWEAKGKTIGFHLGAGFNLNLSNNIALFGETFYRSANFKEWPGTGKSETWEYASWGWTNQAAPLVLPYSWEKNTHRKLNGRLWFYEDIDPRLTTEYYGKYVMLRTAPSPTTSTRNFRPAEINLDGFTFKAGIKVFFGFR